MATAHLDFKFLWTKPDFTLLIKSLYDLVIPFIGNEFSVYGSITETGDDAIKYEFQSLGELETYIKLPFQEFTINIYPANEGRTKWDGRQFRITFEQDSKRLFGTIEVDPADVSDSRKLRNEIQQFLSVQNIPSFEEARVKLINVHRDYYFNNIETTDKLIAISDWLISVIPSQPDRIDGKIRLSDFNLPITEYNKWGNSLGEHWAHIERADFWIETKTLKISIRLDREEQTLDISMDGPDRNELLRNFSVLEEKFNLSEYCVEDEQQLVGYKKMYFVKEGLDAKWIAKLRPLLLSEFQIKHYFRGHYTLLSDPTQEVHLESYSDWEKFLIQNLHTLANGYVWFYRRFLKVDLYFDPFRDWVFLKIEAFNQEEVERIFQKFIQELSLELVEGEPYKHRKSSGTYEILAWQSSNFAEALEMALKVYIGAKYALVNAFVEMGPEKNGEIVPFATVADFLGYLRSAKPYSNAELQVDGPFGRALFVSAFENHQKLEIHSTLHPNDFPELEKIFNNKLVIKKTSYQNQVSTGEKKEQKQFSKDLLKIVLPLILGFLLSSVFWANIFPKYSLSITVPNSLDGKTIVVTTSEIPVEWTMQSEQWFQRKIDRESLATVRVLKDGLTPIRELNLQEPGVILDLNPGIYDIEVVDENSGVSDKVRIEVKEP